MLAKGHRIPRDKKLDNSLALMAEGYLFIPNRSRRFQSDVFQTRLLGGQKVICISGKEAARIFYDNEKFQREGAAPKRVQKSLFGENGIQTMDGAEHENRKHLFMSLMTTERINLIAELTEEQLDLAVNKWEKADRVILFDEAREIMCRVACQWAGVPLKEMEVKQRANDLGAMIDAFGAIGPRHWRGRRARTRSEKWIGTIIKQARAGKLNVSEDTPLHTIALHRDLDGMHMNTHMASVELLNIIRPIVAIARYITFGALALHDYPETRKKLQTGGGNYSQLFVQEVRRFYPFGPFLGARVRKDFIWQGCHFTSGTLVLLDIYGTNHHLDIWKKPDEFRPERFNNWKGSPFNFIPQGGGDYDKGHRCAGEWITIKAMKTSLDYLTKQMEYEVPEQDLSLSLVRMPPIPKSRLVISRVKRSVD